MVTFLPSFWLVVPGSLGLLSVTQHAERPRRGHRRARRRALFVLVSMALGTLVGAALYKRLTETFGAWQLQIGRVRVGLCRRAKALIRGRRHRTHPDGWEPGPCEHVISRRKREWCAEASRKKNESTPRWRIWGPEPIGGCEALRSKARGKHGNLEAAGIRPSPNSWNRNEDAQNGDVGKTVKGEYSLVETDGAKRRLPSPTIMAPLSVLWDDHHETWSSEK